MTNHPPGSGSRVTSVHARVRPGPLPPALAGHWRPALAAGTGPQILLLALAHRFCYLLGSTAASASISTSMSLRGRPVNTVVRHGGTPAPIFSEMKFP